VLSLLAVVSAANAQLTINVTLGDHTGVDNPTTANLAQAVIDNARAGIEEWTHHLLLAGPRTLDVHVRFDAPPGTRGSPPRRTRTVGSSSEAFGPGPSLGGLVPRKPTSLGGRASVGWPRSGSPSWTLAVQADGLAPEVRRITLREHTTVADFTLQPGHILRGQVLDDSGVPMPNVVVRTDTDDGIRQFEWRTQTDAEGRFEWRSAPADPVLFWFEAEAGHEVLRDIPLQADGTEYRVTLRREDR
jgi:hypothetical protein